MVLIQSKKKIDSHLFFPKYNQEPNTHTFVSFCLRRRTKSFGSPLFAHSNQLALPHFSRKGSTLEFVTHAGSLFSLILTVAVCSPFLR